VPRAFFRRPYYFFSSFVIFVPFVVNSFFSSLRLFLLSRLLRLLIPKLIFFAPSRLCGILIF